MTSNIRMTIGNRLLATLSPADQSILEPLLELVPMAFKSVLIAAYEPIEHIIFPLSGIVSTVFNTRDRGIEIGLIGREGMVGLPIALGTDRSPCTYMVQGAGEGLSISAKDFCNTLRDRPSLLRLMGLYTQSLLIQTAQTAYGNISLSIEARLSRWILMTHDRIDGDELPVTHEFLGLMLGAQRTGITIATHTLENLGSIKNQRGRIIVINRSKMIELAGNTYGVAEKEYSRLMDQY